MPSFVPGLKFPCVGLTFHSVIVVEVEVLLVLDELELLSELDELELLSELELLELLATDASSLSFASSFSQAMRPVGQNVGAVELLLRSGIRIEIKNRNFPNDARPSKLWVISRTELQVSLEKTNNFVGT